MTEAMSLVEAKYYSSQAQKKWTELHRSVMTPRWGCSVRRVEVFLQRCRLYEATLQACIQEITHKFVAHPCFTHQSL